MGTETYHRISIGGAIYPAHAEELERLLDFNFYDDDGEHVRDVLTKGEPCTLDWVGMCHNGCDEVLIFCRDHGLTYRLTWEAASGEYGSGGEFWGPGMESPENYCTDEDGEPLVSLRAILDSTPEENAAAFRSLKRWTLDALPPLTLKVPDRLDLDWEESRTAEEA